MILQILMSIIIFILLLIFIIDIVPITIDWVSRIHIGRYNNKSEWNKAITRKGVNWLNHTPKIKVSDNSRFILLDILKGQYSNNTIQHWQEGALLLGLSEYLKYKDDKKIKIEIKNFLNLKFNTEGQWNKKPKHVDAAILSYAVMKLNFINKNQYKPAFDYTIDLIKDHIGEDGTVEYRRNMKGYRYIDTIGFICPFLITYGLMFDNNECIELAIRQIKQYEQNGMWDKTRIPCHAYKLDNHIPLGLYGWGRGLGWYALGLIDAWNELPQRHKYKVVLEESVVKFAESSISFQQENGSWNWTVSRKECRPDSSTTATLGWFMVNASKISNISNECLACSEKALNYLMKVTRRNGEVDFSQGDTKDIGVYSKEFNILPFTQGFCIRMINLYKNQRLVNSYVKKSS